jgi:hypothetical protein
MLDYGKAVVGGIRTPAWDSCTTTILPCPENRWPSA